MKLGINGFIAQGTQVSISDNYVFQGYTESRIMQPITSDTKYKRLKFIMTDGIIPNYLRMILFNPLPKKRLQTHRSTF